MGDGEASQVKVAGNRTSQVLAEKKLRGFLSDLGGSGRRTQMGDQGQALGSCFWNEELVAVIGRAGRALGSKAGLLGKHLPCVLRIPCLGVPLSFTPPLSPACFQASPPPSLCALPTGIDSELTGPPALAHLAPSSLRPEDIRGRPVPREKGGRAGAALEAAYLMSQE